LNARHEHSLFTEGAIRVLAYPNAPNVEQADTAEYLIARLKAER
jgi:hypothetical protein